MTSMSTFGGSATERDEHMVKIKRGILLATPLLKKIQQGARRPFENDPRNQVWMIKAEVIETMLYGCSTWSPNADH